MSATHKSAEVLDMRVGKWVALPSMLEARAYQGECTLVQVSSDLFAMVA